MQLWTEYEGQTIDGAFLLEKLVLSEGRSAFYTARNGDGVSKLLRLIASHFDEEEILTRWRGVDALGHPNLLKIERYGQVELDDTTMVYAIFEPTDAALADVLASQRLTAADAKQLGASLASALQVLHAHGFVHEHVEPGKIFAVGEVVKLRGDCIRETPEGEAGVAAKKKDVHDLAVVLLLSLTQMDRLEDATRVASMPSQLLEVIRKGWDGTWGVAQILTALGGDKAAVPVPAKAPEVKAGADAKAAADAKAVPEAKATPGAGGGPVAAAKDAVVAGEKKEAAPAAAVPAAAVAAAPVAPAAEKVVAKPIPVARPVAVPAAVKDASEGIGGKARFVPPGSREPLVVEEEDHKNPLFTKWAALVAVMVILVLWLVVHSMRSKPEHKDVPAAASAAPAQQTPAPVTPAPVAPGKRSAGKPVGGGHAAAAAPVASSAAVPVARPDAGHEQWRVVSFTYNKQDQAQHKADTIGQAHPDLHPQVFSPTGRAPYLVTVGGVMSKDQAFALAQRVRGMGLPRDSYAQNYGGKAR